MEITLDEEWVDNRVETVPTFRYLGLPLDQMDDDWPAVCQNIMRARSICGEARDTTSTGGVRSQGVGKFP